MVKEDGAWFCKGIGPVESFVWRGLLYRLKPNPPKVLQEPVVNPFDNDACDGFRVL